jgi:hypothetical protein
VIWNLTYDVYSKKYSNFCSPTVGIFVNGEDVLGRHNKQEISVVVEQKLNEVSKFRFTVVDDAQFAWVSDDFFEVGKTVQVLAGYANVSEALITADIAFVKAVFSSTQKPLLIVAGETKQGTSASHAIGEGLSSLTLDYGRLLLDFTCETYVGKSFNEKPTNVQFSGKCIGLPDIKPGSIIKIVGLGTKFNQTCTVTQAIHTIDGSGYSTTFDAYAQPERPVRPNKPVIKTLKDRQIQMG